MSDAIDSGPPAQLAGFWRRLGAFVLDCLILGLVGLALAFTVYDQLAHLGVWGRLFGFALALAYFGVSNSKLTSGRSVGKLALGIKVVDKDGTPLSVGKSFLRYVALAIPWFLNGAPFPASVLFSFWLYVISLAVFGAGLSILYLFIFNRPSRQSLHDLLVGSFVVRSDAIGPVGAAAPWRGHLMVCAALFLAAAAVPVFTSRLAQSETFGPLLMVHRVVSAEPWVAHAEVNRSLSLTSKDVVRHLSIVAHIRDPAVDDADRAMRLGRLAFGAHEFVRDLTVVQVTLVHGFDIGIASSWRSHSHNFAPRDLAAAD